MAKKTEHKQQKQYCNKFNKDFKMVHIKKKLRKISNHYVEHLKIIQYKSIMLKDKWIQNLKINLKGGKESKGS